MQSLKNNKNLAIPEQFQRIIGDIHGISYPTRQGATSEVIFLYTEQGNFVCKRSSLPKYRTWLAKEANVMKQLNTNATPAIPMYHDFVEEENNSFLLMSLEEGVHLREALLTTKGEEDKKNLFYSFGSMLRMLHETAPPSNWEHKEKWIDMQLQRSSFNLQHFEVDGDQQLLDSLKNSQSVDIAPKLIHGDCTIDNALVVDNQVHMFIDLSETTYGDPRYDIALAIRSVLYDKTLLNAFYEGYKLLQISKEEFDYLDGGLYEFF